MDNSINILKSAKNFSHPKVCIVGCLHGNESVGKKIIVELTKLNLKKGQIKTIIGNPEAFNKNTRFIKQDVNRSFPGKSQGNYEQKLAYKIKREIADFNFVIDIHSTTSEFKDLVVAVKINKSMVRLINYFKPKSVIIMKKSIGKTSMIYYCKAGISLEYGKDKSSHTFNKTLGDIKKILVGLGMIDVPLKSKEKENRRTTYYRVFGVAKKESGSRLSQSIKNLKLIKKGSIIGVKKDGTAIVAKNNFYPILFGEKEYKDMFGFVAKRLDNVVE